MRTRLIVDLSSVLWSCLLVGKDTEFGYEVPFTLEGSDVEKMVHVNSAQHGYENSVNHFVALLDKAKLVPMDMVLVVEGLHGKLLRQNILPEYKAKRDRPEAAYTEFNKAKELLIQAFTSLGAIAVSQDGIEADDVISYLVMKLEGKKIIDSNDGDLCALISDGSTETKDVSVYKMSKSDFLYENPYGPFTCKHILTYKSIVGDTGDKIPGAKGFGAKTWLDFLCNYDEDALDELLRLITAKKLDELAEDVPTFKPLQKIIDAKDQVFKSYQCAKFYTSMVNSVRKPLNWTPGMVKPVAQCEDPRLKQWAGKQRLIHAANFVEATAWMVEHIAASPFISFDIETSSNDTADQWLLDAKTKSNESKDAESIDVFGAELCSFALTFGCNMQYTFYFTVAHVETAKVKNITKAQAKQVLEMLPKSKVKAIQNVSFELPIVMNELGPLQEVE
jgi:5'-3' exonuclease